jgi:ComF family protein
MPPAAGADALCGVCQKRPPPFHRTLAPFHYAAPLDHLVHQFKFRHRMDHARLLGSLMAHYVADHMEHAPDVIVPVPLHVSRLKERGYNQALELARPLSRRLGIPLDYGVCRRERATQTQADLDAAGRRSNIRGAFAVAGPIDRTRVAVVDDVITTGSTVGELTKTLLRAGAARVEVWACAKTVTT